MSDYRVDKQELPVMIFLSDGMVHEGVMFLSPFSPSHSGEQTLLELFRDADAFLPFRDKADQFMLVNKNAVTHVRYPVQEGPAPIGVSKQVRLTFFGGENLEGTLSILMPEGKNRTQDFINSSPGFFNLDAGEAHYVVNGHLIREIIPS